MRLFASEWKKLWSGRGFLLALAVLLCLNLFLLWTQTKPGGTDAPAAAYRQMGRDLDALPDMDAKSAFLEGKLTALTALVQIDELIRAEAYGENEYTRQIREARAEVITEYGALYESREYLEYTGNLALEARFLGIICAEFREVYDYDGFLAEIDARANQLSGISIFATKGGDSYSEQNITATAEAYRHMGDLSPDYTPQKGLRTAITYGQTDLVLLIIMLALAATLVRQERDSGLLGFVRTTPGGRLHTAWAKVAVLAVSLLAVLVLLYGINLLYCAASFGLGGLARPIQSYFFLMRSTLRLSVGQYLLCYLATKWAAAFVLGLWVMLAMLLPANLFAGYGLAVLFPAAGWGLRAAIPPTSHWNVAKYANMASLLNTNEILGGYRNLYWLGSPVQLVLVESPAAFLFFALFLLSFLWLFSRAVLREAGRGRVLWRMPVLGRQKPACTTLARQEAYKLFALQGAALLLFVLAGLVFYQGAGTEVYEAADEMLYRQYAQRLSGPYTPEKYNWLLEEYERFAPLRELEDKTRRGLLSPQDYEMARSQMGGLGYAYAAYQKILEEDVAYIGQHSGAQFVYGEGYRAFFDLQTKRDLNDVLLAGVFVSLCSAGLFAMERQSGMARIIAATPLGRGFTVKRKLGMLAASGGAVGLLLWVPRIFEAAARGGFPALFAPLISLPEYQNAPAFVPIIGLMLYAVLARVLLCVAFSWMAAALSWRIGKILPALFACLLLLALPAALAAAGIDGLAWLSGYPVFHVAAFATQTDTTIAAFLYLLILCTAGWPAAQSIFERFGKAGRI